MCNDAFTGKDLATIHLAFDMLEMYREAYPEKFQEFRAAAFSRLATTVIEAAAAEKEANG